MNPAAQATSSPLAERQVGVGLRGGAVPAWSQICASVIQGCSGPCLGVLLCRDDATSDSACSTLEAATDVAWTEPAGGFREDGIRGERTEPASHRPTQPAIPLTHRHGFKTYTHPSLTMFLRLMVLTVYTVTMAWHLSFCPSL